MTKFSIRPSIARGALTAIAAPIVAIVMLPAIASAQTPDKPAAKPPVRERQVAQRPAPPQAAARPDRPAQPGAKRDHAGQPQRQANGARPADHRQFADNRDNRGGEGHRHPRPHDRDGRGQGGRDQGGQDQRGERGRG